MEEVCMDTAQTNPSTAAIDSLFAGTGAIDMTPDTKSELATTADNGWVTLPQPTSAISPILRSETTARHVDDVMGSLDFAAVRLEGAMYRLGYLESQVDVLQEQLKVLSEFRSRAAKAVIVERENMMLQKQMSEYEEELEETHRIMDKLNQSKAWHFFRWLFRIEL